MVTVRIEGYWSQLWDTIDIGKIDDSGWNRTVNLSVYSTATLRHHLLLDDTNNAESYLTWSCSSWGRLHKTDVEELPRQCSLATDSNYQSGSLLCPGALVPRKLKNLSVKINVILRSKERETEISKILINSHVTAEQHQPALLLSGHFLIDLLLREWREMLVVREFVWDSWDVVRASLLLSTYPTQPCRLSCFESDKTWQLVSSTCETSSIIKNAGEIILQPLDLFC